MVAAFVGGSLVALLCLYFATPLLSRLGNRWFLFIAVSIDLAALATLALIPDEPLAALVALLFHLAMAPIIGYSLDIFFERALPHDQATGLARGVFLTAGNVALIASPLIAGYILSNHQASLIYGISAGALFIFIVCMLLGNRRYVDPSYPKHATINNLGRTLVGPLGPVIASHFVLRVFYGWAPVYLPLYLTQLLGFSWTETGIILALSLIPFALFELPLGQIEDRYIGEREILVFGFIVLAAAICALWVVPAKTFLAMAVIMFMTRVGASFIEIATETHFFRQVSAEHADAITLFRMLGPIGWIVGVGLAASTLAYMPMPYAFGILSAAALIGIVPALRIHDAK